MMRSHLTFQPIIVEKYVNTADSICQRVNRRARYDGFTNPLSTRVSRDPAPPDKTVCSFRTIREAWSGGGGATLIICDFWHLFCGWSCVQGLLVQRVRYCQKQSLPSMLQDRNFNAFVFDSICVMNRAQCRKLTKRHNKAAYVSHRFAA